MGIWGDNMAGHMESQAWAHGEIDRPYIFDNSNAWSLTLFRYLLFIGCSLLCSTGHFFVSLLFHWWSIDVTHCFPKSTYTKLRVDCTVCSRSARFFVFLVSSGKIRIMFSNVMFEMNFQVLQQVHFQYGCIILS